MSVALTETVIILLLVVTSEKEGEIITFEIIGPAKSELELLVIDSAFWIFAIEFPWKLFTSLQLKPFKR